MWVPRDPEPDGDVRAEPAEREESRKPVALNPSRPAQHRSMDQSVTVPVVGEHVWHEVQGQTGCAAPSVTKRRTSDPSRALRTETTSTMSALWVIALRWTMRLGIEFVWSKFGNSYASHPAGTASNMQTGSFRTMDRSLTFPQTGADRASGDSMSAISSNSETTVWSSSSASA